ncbi:hypothetical protein NL676_024451 [Syzygium grande]|nr:hypothetical protein NL676_024451 [Syzygium grande]
MAKPKKKASLCVEQYSMLRGLGDTKLLWRCLRAARARRDRCACRGRARRVAAVREERMSCSICSCQYYEKTNALNNVQALDGDENFSVEEEEEDVLSCVGDEEVHCVRSKFAALSLPFTAMLYGHFAESKEAKINFSLNGISTEGLRAVEIYSRTKSNLDDALILIEYGLEETSYLLVASCLQVLLSELPRSLRSPGVMKILCSSEGRDRLSQAGHASFLLYYFLSQVAMEESMVSNITVMLLERLKECSTERWQKALSLHQLGRVMLERKIYGGTEHYFEAAPEYGHVYSIAGIARAKYEQGQQYSAYKMIDSLISENTMVGWMYQERSLYGVGREKLLDVISATGLDPMLSFPCKYRALIKVEEKQIKAAVLGLTALSYVLDSSLHLKIMEV